MRNPCAIERRKQWRASKKPRVEIAKQRHQTCSEGVLSDPTRLENIPPTLLDANTIKIKGKIRSKNVEEKLDSTWSTCRAGTASDPNAQAKHRHDVDPDAKMDPIRFSDARTRPDPTN